MNETIKVLENHPVIRRQILIVETPFIMKHDDLDNIRKSIIEQMKRGLVVLPNGFTAKVCDADTIAFMVDEK